MDKPRHPLIEGDWSEPEFQYLKDNIWCGTEKIDGTNTRIQFTGDSVAYKGKTDEAQYFPGMLERLKEILPLEKLQSVFTNQEGETTEICLYGETYGKGIQSVGRQYKSSVDFILFDIKIGKWWLRRVTVEEIAKELNIPVVPIVFIGTLEQAIKKVKEGYASRVAEQDNVRAEGMIMFPEVQLFNRKGERIITKLKYKDFK